MSSQVAKILTEDVLSIAEARAELGSITGRRPDVSTMHRWIHRGVGGVRLEAVWIGKQIVTSRQAMTRFIEQRTSRSIG
jgi:hypothetical protein